MWTVEFDEVPKPSKVSFKLWEDFVEWLKYQNIMMIVDFELSIKTKYKISEDGKHAKENDENKITCYEREEIRHGQQTHVQIDIEVIKDWKKIIAEIKPNRALEACGTFYANVEDNEQRCYPFNEEITKSIEDNNALAATDASVKE